VQPPSHVLHRAVVQVAVGQAKHKGRADISHFTAAQAVEAALRENGCGQGELRANIVKGVFHDEFQPVLVGNLSSCDELDEVEA